MFGADGGSNRVPFHPLHRDSWELSMLHHVKTLGYKISTFLVAFSVIAALCGETLSASASPSTELKKMFRQMDRQLCRSISPDRCKHKKRSTALHPQFQNEITPTKPSAPSELASPSVAVDVRGATKQSVMPPSPSVAPPSPRVDVKAKSSGKEREAFHSPSSHTAAKARTFGLQRRACPNLGAYIKAAARQNRKKIRAICNSKVSTRSRAAGSACL